MAKTQNIADVCVIGAGAVGCAVANALSNRGMKVLVLDFNPKPGMGTTSRNSEVIHAGLYYPTGSLKAKLCVEGRRLLYPFCERYGVAHKKIEKLIVATSNDQEDELEKLLNKGAENEVEGLSRVSGDYVRTAEPHVNAVSALRSAESGIISAHELCDCYCALATNNGAQFVFNTALIGLEQTGENWRITTDAVSPNGNVIEAGGTQAAELAPHVALAGEPFSGTVKYVVNSAGLYADYVAALAGIDVDKANYRLNWVRGDYFSLSPAWGKRLNHLIYPLPEKNLRGLGVHVTLDLGGQARLGPNTIEIQRKEMYSVDSQSKSSFFQAAARYLRDLTEDELTPTMAGIRPKLSKPGEPARDFVISEESAKGCPGLINLIGLESPGLTSSLAIAKVVSSLVD